MSKYKIHIDKKLPAKDQVEQYKNFDGLLSDYKKLHSVDAVRTPLYKDKKFRSLILLIFIVLLTLYFSREAIKSDVKKVKPQTTEQPLLNQQEP